MKNDKSTTHFSKNLLKELKKRKIKQKAFAKKLGITQTTLSNYCTGKRIPNLDIVLAIADEFNCSLDQLCSKNISQYKLSKNEECLINLFNMYNNQGQTFILQIVESVAYNPRYVDEKKLEKIKKLVEDITIYIHNED